MAIVKPSKYQQDIFTSILTTTSNVGVAATAGSGKTTTLVEMAKLLPYSKRALFVAFNKHIVNELKNRLPRTLECSTMHSLGFSAIRKHFPGNVRLDEKKQIGFIMPLFSKEQNQRKKWVSIYEVDGLMKLMRATMTELNEDSINKLIERYALDTDPTLIPKAIRALKDFYAFNSDTDNKHDFSVDFADMIEFCVLSKEVKMPQFDYVLVDEAQDLSHLDQLFINKLVKPITGRKIIVGDENQCQPKGTKVLMWNGRERKIENLKVGDDVVAYDVSGRGGFVGFCPINKKKRTVLSSKIEVIKKRKVKNEPIIVLNVAGNITKYSYNHKCYVRFRSDITQGYVLYLMRKGQDFRIGVSRLFGSHQSHFSMRARNEEADEFWILNIYETKKLAYLNEQFYSIEYGLPQMIFNYRQNGTSTKEEIEAHYLRFDKKRLRESAITVLNLFQKDILFPIWSSGFANRYSKLGIFKVQACNIFSDYMQMVVFNPKKIRVKRRVGRVDVNRVHAEYKDIIDLTYENYNGFLYSLKINTYKNYVADKVLTSNSIYSFRGASTNSFREMVGENNTVQLPLSICYRCAKSIIREAKKIYPVIEENPDQIEGVVRQGKEKMIEEMTDNDMVICRNTRPLVSVFFKLVEMGKKAYILGKDIEKGLKALLVNIDDSMALEAIEEEFERFKQKLEASLKEKNISQPKNNVRYVELEEKLKILQILFGKFEKVSIVEEFIENTFNDEETEGIKLSTIHKAKGMEADRVFWIREFEGKALIPSKYAVTKDQLIQEKNLSFVATTRSKRELIYVDL